MPKIVAEAHSCHCNPDHLKEMAILLCMGRHMLRMDQAPTTVKVARDRLRHSRIMFARPSTVTLTFPTSQTAQLPKMKDVYQI